MNDGSKSPPPVSLDALLSASRDSFDRLFEDQMSGGRANRDSPPVLPAGDATPAASTRPPRADDGEAIIADLNRRFTTGWSAETLESETRDGRVRVRCRLIAGDAEAIETGSASVDSADPEAAERRACHRALEKAAAAIGRGTDRTGSASTTPSAQVDIVLANRIEAALSGICREMETILTRSALSYLAPNAPLGMAMVMDGHGHMIAGRHGGFAAHLLDAHDLHLDPGDVLLVGDPYASGGATGGLDDWLILAPVHHHGELIGYSTMHGRAAGAHASADAGSIFAEGVRIPPVKLYQAGTLIEPALDIILANSRDPGTSRVDLMALIAACHAGGERLGALNDRHGAETVHRATRMLRQRTQAAMRQRIIALIPEEPQTFEDQIDDDGAGNGPFKLKLTVWREGEHAYFDWTGTSAQAPGPVNHLLHVGLAKTFVGRELMRDLGDGMGAGLVLNDGYYDLIHVTLPSGSLLCPVAPAPVGHNEHTMVRHLEALGAAVGRHRPARLSAAGNGSVPSFVFRGDGFAMTDPVFGGQPAAPDRDGGDGHALWPGPRTRSAEKLEARYPVVIESCRAVPGSGGAGQWRGGNAVEKIYRMDAPGDVSLHDDRHASAPWGVRGGRPGAHSAKWIVRADGQREALGAKIEGLAVLPGDRIVFRTAAGGGCGPARERDPARVQNDVAAGLLTVDAAANDYAVVIDAASLQIDWRATEELRSGKVHDSGTTKLFDRGDQA